MNVICLMGRLTGDPELKTTQNGVSVTSFSVAVDRAYRSKDQERQTDFINCVAWRNTAEFISRYFHKGQRIVVDNAFFCESKGGNAGGTPGYDSQIPAYSEAKPAFSTANSGDFEDVFTDEDLPF